MGERNQEESLLSTWAGTQQKVLAGWLDIVQAIERPGGALCGRCRGYLLLRRHPRNEHTHCRPGHHGFQRLCVAEPQDGGHFLLKFQNTVEIEDGTKPALIAETLALLLPGG